MNTKKKLYLKEIDKSIIYKKNSIKNTMKIFLLKVKPTYYDKKCTKLQCYFGKNRSVSDLYCIMGTLFKSLNKKKFFKYLKEILEENLDLYRLIYCPHVGKIVVYKGFTASDPFKYKFIHNYGKYLSKKGKLDSKNKDNLSLNDILENMGLKRIK